LRALLACEEVEKVVVTVRADVLEEAKGWVKKECEVEGARVVVIVAASNQIGIDWVTTASLGGSRWQFVSR
jgi:hypothetical protein